MSYFTLAGIPIRVITPSAVMDYQPTVQVKPFIGQLGSNTKSLGRKGKELKLTVVVRDYDDVETIRFLAFNHEVIPLVSEARGGYNVKWRIIGFVQKDESTPSNPDAFEFDITLQEHVDFKITKKNITNWKVAPKKVNPCVSNVAEAAKKAKVTLGPSNLKLGQQAMVAGKTMTAAPKDMADWAKCTKNTASNGAKLANCGTLKKTASESKDKKVQECVKELKRALKSGGYYSYKDGQALVINGWFGPKTHAAVINLQKKKGISPANGVVDAKTRAKL
jgi:hypothetical protein